MKRIVRALYAGNLSVLADAKDEHVQSALDMLQARLEDEMGKTYRWLASCTVAVEAGRWGGERRRKRREKLLTLINACRVRLGQEEFVPSDRNWSSFGLYYGYGACHSYGQDRNLDWKTVFVTGVSDANGPAAAALATNLVQGL